MLSLFLLVDEWLVFDYTASAVVFRGLIQSTQIRGNPGGPGANMTSPKIPFRPFSKTRKEAVASHLEKQKLVSLVHLIVFAWPALIFFSGLLLGSCMTLPGCQGLQ